MYESPPIVKKKYGGFLIVVSNICHGQFLLKEVFFDTHSRNLNPRNIGILTFTKQDRRSPTTALPMFSEGLLQSRISTSDLSFMSGIEMCSVHHVSTCCQQLCSALKALKSKCQSLSQSVSQWVTMSPIMLAWKAKKNLSQRSNLIASLRRLWFALATATNQNILAQICKRLRGPCRPQVKWSRWLSKVSKVPFDKWFPGHPYICPWEANPSKKAKKCESPKDSCQGPADEVEDEKQGGGQWFASRGKSLSLGQLAQGIAKATSGNMGG